METDLGALERKLEEAAQALDQRAQAFDVDKRVRDQAMSELVAAGVGLERIAKLAGLSKGRVSQIVNSPSQKRAICRPLARAAG